MTIEYFNSLVNEIGNLRDHLIDQYRKFIADNTRPLNERWEAFELVDEYLPTDNWGDGFIDILEPGSTLYDEFYMERRESSSYKDLWDRIVDRGTYSEDVLNTWREEVIAAGCGSFRYDW